MKIVALSDTHGWLPEVKQSGDVFVHAGDFSDCHIGKHSYIGHQKYINNVFIPWLAKIDAEHKIIVAGNHDTILENSLYSQIIRDLFRDNGFIYLEDSSIEIDGATFYGSPWTPAFCSWAFNGPAVDNKHWYKMRWSGIPEQTDVLITHGPPLSILDKAHDMHLGSPCLLDRVLDVRCKLHLFGHIHECNGIEVIRDIVFGNVCHVDGNYTPIYKEKTFDI